MDICGDFSSFGTRVVLGSKKLPGYPTGTRVPAAALQCWRQGWHNIYCPIFHIFDMFKFNIYVRMQ